MTKVSYRFCISSLQQASRTPFDVSTLFEGEVEVYGRATLSGNGIDFEVSVDTLSLQISIYVKGQAYASKVIKDGFDLINDKDNPSIMRAIEARIADDWFEQSRVSVQRIAKAA